MPSFQFESLKYEKIQFWQGSLVIDNVTCVKAISTAKKKAKDKKSEINDKKSKSGKNKKDHTEENSQVGGEKTRESKRPKPNYVRPGQKPFLFNMPPLMGGMGMPMGGMN